MLIEFVQHPYDTLVDYIVNIPTEDLSQEDTTVNDKYSHHGLIVGSPLGLVQREIMGLRSTVDVELQSPGLKANSQSLKAAMEEALAYEFDYFCLLDAYQQVRNFKSSQLQYSNEIVGLSPRRP